MLCIWRVLTTYTKTATTTVTTNSHDTNATQGIDFAYLCVWHTS